MTFLTPTVFRAAIPLPADVPIGNYAIDVKLFADGATGRAHQFGAGSDQGRLRAICRRRRARPRPALRPRHRADGAAHRLDRQRGVPKGLNLNPAGSAWRRRHRACRSPSICAVKASVPNRSAKAASRTLSPPVKAPKAGITRRVASAAKQRRLTARPRCATRATGCRWPAISPAAPVGRWRKVKRADRQRRLEHAADIGRRLGIVIAGDPDPVAAALQGAAGCRGRRGQAAPDRRRRGSCRPAPPRSAARSARSGGRGAPASPRYRRAAAACRARRSSSLFPDAGRRPRAGLARANRARRRDRRSSATPATAMHDPLVPASGDPASPGFRALRGPTGETLHRIASFTSSSAASASSASAASP